MTTAPHDAEGPDVHPGALGSSIAFTDRWGPFATDIEPSERLARLRCLRVIAHLICGPRGLDLQGRIRMAERDASEPNLIAVVSALARMAPLDQRHVLASYAVVSRVN